MVLMSCSDHTPKGQSKQANTSHPLWFTPKGRTPSLPRISIRAPSVIVEPPVLGQPLGDGEDDPHLPVLWYPPHVADP